MSSASWVWSLIAFGFREAQAIFSWHIVSACFSCSLFWDTSAYRLDFSSCPTCSLKLSWCFSYFFFSQCSNLFSLGQISSSLIFFFFYLFPSTEFLISLWFFFVFSAVFPKFCHSPWLTLSTVTLGSMSSYFILWVLLESVSVVSLFQFSVTWSPLHLP